MRRQTRGTETSKYPEEESKCDSLSSGERNGISPNQEASWGCRTLCTELQKNEVDEEVWKGPP